MLLSKRKSHYPAEKQAIREKIFDFEQLIGKQEGAFFGDSVHCPLKHSFTDGIYVREISIPAGTFLTGKIHRHAHPNFLMSGTVIVVTEEGGEEELTGPMAMISPAGTKRALYAVTDLVWVTVHHNPTNTQDLDKLEKIVIAKNYEEYGRFKSLQENRIYKFLNRIKQALLGKF